MDIDTAQIKAAQKRLKEFKSLNWLADHAREVQWKPEDDGSVSVKPTCAPVEGREPFEGLYPVVVRPDGSVDLPTLGITNYPDDKSRESLPKPPPAVAVAFLCTRHKNFVGHSSLYLHYPSDPSRDRYYSLNGQPGLRRIRTNKPDIINERVDVLERKSELAVNQFLGFPLSEAQAQMMEFDARFIFSNPHFSYDLFNRHDDAANCTGICLQLLNLMDAPTGVLRGHPEQDVSYMLERPNVIYRDLEYYAEPQTSRRCKVPLQHHELGHPAELHVQRTADGLLLGRVMGTDGKLARGRHPYILYDASALIRHISPHVVGDDGGFRELPTCDLPALNAAPLETLPRGAMHTGRSGGF